MNINLLDDLRDSNLLNRFLRKARNIIWLLSWIITAMFCILTLTSIIAYNNASNPTISQKQETFYGYGKHIEYHDYDIDKPCYMLITSSNDLSDKYVPWFKINNHYDVKEKDMQLFKNQQVKKAKYTTNIILSNQSISSMNMLVILFCGISVLFWVCWFFLGELQMD